MWKLGAEPRKRGLGAQKLGDKPRKQGLGAQKLGV